MRSRDPDDLTGALQEIIPLGGPSGERGLSGSLLDRG
jgi:hypothetical protein